MAEPTLINFSVAQGTNEVLEFDIATGPVEITGASASWDLYEQEGGVITNSTAIVSKVLDYGIEAENDGEITSFSIELEVADTAGRLGNFYYEAKLVDGDGKNIALAYGFLTITGFAVNTITARSLKLRFPELADYEDHVLEMAIYNATLIVGDNDGWIEDDLLTARMYLAAHFAVKGMDDAESEGGNVVSESIGRLSVSYARSSAGDRVAALQTTSYGERFLTLQRGSFAGPLVI